MAHQQPVSIFDSQPHQAPDRPASTDLVEEVRCRWVSIASYYVAQSLECSESATADGWLDAAQEYSLAN